MEIAIMIRKDVVVVVTESDGTARRVTGLITGKHTTPEGRVVLHVEFGQPSASDEDLFALLENLPDDTARVVPR